MSKGQNNHKIGVLCYYSFPEGMAPTTRILSYCKGLQANGVNTEVFSYKVALPNDNAPLTGYADGVKYNISHKWKREHSRIFKLLFGHLLVFFMTIRKIIKSNRNSKFDYIFLSLDNPIHLSLYSSVLALCGIRSIFIGDEFPEPIRKLKSNIPFWYIVLYKFSYIFIDKRILMTDKLREFYDKTVCPKPTFILNSVVDSSRFEKIQSKKSGPEYICYMGNMQLAKDNVDNIVRAFSLIQDDFPELYLYLYGTPSQNDRQYLDEVVKECGCRNKIIFKGRASYDSVPQILADAKLLVNSQPDTVRAQGGFPTKLAEYMMAGVPVVLTDVGEISLYVSDSESVYLVEPCNPTAFAEKLKYILEHPFEAQLVARNAYALASDNWGNVGVTKNLLPFLYV